MRLFHVSEESDICVFEPRIPTRQDLDPNTGLVWAIDEKRLPNFLTPRDCPRVAYYATNETTLEDKKRFFSSFSISHCIVIENRWLDRLRNTTLYLYEFDPQAFVLQDEIAGYYVATITQRPIARYQLNDVLGELVKRNIEIRITDYLWDIADDVKKSTLNWSLCRMAFASPRP
ncbi:MAG: hypothetical protein E7329_05865 [Clostridiales bacterium]|nr:hypothetical protein [Clostridiales bacterium]